MLESGHKPLVFLIQAKHSIQRLIRWPRVRHEYHSYVKYIKGTENVAALILFVSIQYFVVLKGEL